MFGIEGVFTSKGRQDEMPQSWQIKCGCTVESFGDAVP